MMKGKGATGPWSKFLGILLCVSGLPIPVFGADLAATPQAPTASSNHRRGGLEDRVQTLAKALDLDVRQQLGLRKALESQREMIRKLWQDPSVPAERRVVTVQAISDQTADRIRDLLNEEQRKKYYQPRQKHEAAAGETPRSVEDWMNTMQSK